MTDQIPPSPSPSDQITPGVPQEKDPAAKKLKQQIEAGKKLMVETPSPSEQPASPAPPRPETVLSPEVPVAPPPIEVSRAPVSEPSPAVTLQEERTKVALTAEKKAREDLARAREDVQTAQEDLERAAFKAEATAKKTAARVETGSPMITQPATQTVESADKAAIVAAGMKEDVKDVKAQTTAVQAASRATARELKSLSFERQKAALEQGRKESQSEGTT